MEASTSSALQQISVAVVAYAGGADVVEEQNFDTGVAEDDEVHAFAVASVEEGDVVVAWENHFVDCKLRDLACTHNRWVAAVSAAVVEPNWSSFFAARFSNLVLIQAVVGEYVVAVVEDVESDR